MNYKPEREKRPALEKLLDAIFAPRQPRRTMRVKIKDGTPEFGKSLCYTCKSAGIVKGQNGELIIHCNACMFEHCKNLVPFQVAECNAYTQLNVPDKWEMEKIAWTVEARKRGPKGFEVSAGEDEMEVVITKPKKKQGNDINWPDD
jgi:hypothetical protein